MNAYHSNETTIIKKYSNRRLYNTQTSCYVTLDDLYTMIKNGEIFEVVDAKTNENLTRTILTQIIFAQEEKGYNLLPVAFLRHLIRLYGENLGDIFPNYIEASMESFLKHQENLRHFSHTNWNIGAFKIIEELTKHNIEIFENTINTFLQKNASSK